MIRNSPLVGHTTSTLRPFSCFLAFRSAFCAFTKPLLMCFLCRNLLMLTLWCGRYGSNDCRCNNNNSNAADLLNYSIDGFCPSSWRFHWIQWVLTFMLIATEIKLRYAHSGYICLSWLTCLCAWVARSNSWVLWWTSIGLAFLELTRSELEKNGKKTTVKGEREHGSKPKSGLERIKLIE